MTQTHSTHSTEVGVQPDDSDGSRIRTPENAERRRLGYASFDALTQRAALVMTKGFVPDSATTWGNFTTLTKEAIAVQTETMPVRDIGVGVSDDAIIRERTEDLKLDLCPAHQLPAMTVPQLIEVERRLSNLMRVLESEIERASEQERRRLEQQLEHSSAPTTVSQFETTAQWTQKISKNIERRLRRRHGDPEGITPALFWHRTKAELVASPPRAKMLTSVVPMGTTTTMSPSRIRSPPQSVGIRPLSSSPPHR